MTPDGWCRVDLSDVADQRIEKVVPVETDKRPYVALEHLAQGSPALIGWSEAGTAASAKTVFRAGDVLFGKLRPYLRKAAPAPFDGLCSTDILPLFSKRTLDTRYLAQLAQWRPLQQHAVATSSGTKMPRTSWAQLGEFRFSLPPLPEQRKIAAILSSVDDAIEKTQAVIDQVQVVKRGLMQELLTRGLPGRHTRFKPLPNWRLGRVASNLKQIPESWDLVSIASVARLESGHTPSRRKPQYWHGNVPWISLHDTVQLDRPEIRNTEQNISELGLKNSSARLLPKGTVVFSRTATIGKSTIMAREMSTTQDFVNYTCGSRLHNRYLMQLLRHMRPEWRRLMAGSTHKTVYMPIFEQLEILLPPVEEQEEIANIVERLESRVETERKVNARLGNLKSALMSVLLSGELRVTPDTEAA